VSGGRGFEFAVRAPAQRAILQACGRMIRSEHDRGLAIILDRRVAQFTDSLPGLAPIEDLPATARRFYGRRARWARTPGAVPGGSSGPASGPSAAKP
jgi:hypothetical protein